MCTQGERIKKARKHLQLSLQQLGEVLNVSKQYLSKIEKNERLLNNRKLSMLISKYNINVNYIYTLFLFIIISMKKYYYQNFGINLICI